MLILRETVNKYDTSGPSAHKTDVIAVPSFPSFFLLDHLGKPHGKSGLHRPSQLL